MLVSVISSRYAVSSVRCTLVGRCTTKSTLAQIRSDLLYFINSCAVPFEYGRMRGNRDGVWAYRRVGVGSRSRATGVARPGNVPLPITGWRSTLIVFLRSRPSSCSRSMNVQRRSRGSATLPATRIHTPIRRYADPPIRLLPRCHV